MTTHTVQMTDATYPRGLRLFECGQCPYAYMALVDGNGVPDWSSREVLNNGDVTVTHSLFVQPPNDLRMRMKVDMSEGF